MTHPDVLVLGGGIIGLACARALARRGLAVEVVERDRVGGAASWAAAGMLSALAEAIGSQPFLDACRRSRDLWPSWASELEEESGLEVDLDRTGALVVDLADDGRARRLARLARDSGEPATDLGRDELRALVPDIHPSAAGGLLLLGEYRVDNRKACAALERSAERAGVRISEGLQVTTVRAGGDAVRLDGPGWSRSGGRLLVAAGAWAGSIEGLPSLPISPVRGQMLQLAGVEWPWSGTIWGAHHLYAVRRAGGGLLIGATVEEGAGFDTWTTPAGIYRLCEFVNDMFPTLADNPLHSTWAGLRPGTPDRLPMLGPWSASPVWIAGGHFRSGILLAPWTAEVIADGMTGGDGGVDLASSDFSPVRFALSPAG